MQDKCDKQVVGWRMLAANTRTWPSPASYMQNVQKDNPNYKLIPTMTQIDKSRHRWSGETGYVNREMLSRNNAAMSSAVYYIAGPPTAVCGRCSIRWAWTMTMFAAKILQAIEGLDQPWQSYDLRHELTEKRIRKFAEGYRKTAATL